MSETGLAGLVNRLLEWIRPLGFKSPREAFQLRFFLSAAVLGLMVAIPSGIFAVIADQMISAIVVGVFAAALMLHLLVARFGARASFVMWSLIATVALFLVVGSCVTQEIDPTQLYWLIMIPLGARAFTAPRVEDLSPSNTLKVTVVATVFAIGAAVLIVVLHSVGLTLEQPVKPDPPWLVAVNFALFATGAMGLVMLYDVSATMTIAELQRVRELLSICAWCRKINSGDAWISLEDFTTQHTRLDLSHGICPSCSEQEIQRMKATLASGLAGSDQ